MPRTTAIYLDAVRFLSAATVFIYHLSYSGFGGRWIPRGDFGIDAVMVFFVLSGFIIAYTAERERTFAVFMTNRLARLWSVVVPALILTFAADTIGRSINPNFYAAASYQGDVPLFRLLISGIFLNEIWFRSISPLSNLPFWSLGYEFWYYLLFAAGVYLSGLARKTVICAAALIVGPKILLLLPIWLLGAIIYRVHNRWKVSPVGSFVMFFSPLLLYAAFKVMHVHQLLNAATQSVLGPELFGALAHGQNVLWFYLIGLLIGVHFLGFFSIQHRFEFITNVAAPVRRLAGCTFSCYLFHFPLFILLGSFLMPDPNSIELSIVIGIIAAVAIAIMGPPAESSRYALRSYLAEKFGALIGSNASVMAALLRKSGPTR